MTRALVCFRARDEALVDVVPTMRFDVLESERVVATGEVLSRQEPHGEVHRHQGWASFALGIVSLNGATKQVRLTHRMEPLCEQTAPLILVKRRACERRLKLTGIEPDAIERTLIKWNRAQFQRSHRLSARRTQSR